MKYEHYLMERVRLGGSKPRSASSKDSGKYRQSVLGQLQEMFNVRQGSCLCNNEFGLPDFNDLDSSEGFAGALTEYSKSIKDQIERYSPGLNRVRVRYINDVEDPLNIRFEITGRLNVNGGTERVKFETQKLSNGAIKVVS